MKDAAFELPSMFGDHHVLAVRALLLALPGVDDVYASSSFQIVEIKYDEDVVSEDDIRSVLAEAGYLEGLAIPTETGATAPEMEKPFFRHTAAFAQTGLAISFAQDIPDPARALWPCPGLK